MWDVDELFRGAVEQYPDRTAVIDSESRDRYSYSEMNDIVDRIAAGLRSYGVTPGDRVALTLPNVPEHVFLALAVQRVGAVAVPFNFRVNPDKLGFFVRDSDPELMVFCEQIADAVLEQRKTLDCETFVTTADIDAAGVDSYEQLLQEPDPSAAVSVEPDDLSIIQYSSGTTGKPKGIQLTHRVGINRVFLNLHSQQPYDNDTMLGEIPLYHTIGFHANLLSMLATGGTYIPMPEFDPKKCLRLIYEEDVTALHAVPVMYKHMIHGREKMREQRQETLAGTVSSLVHQFSQRVGVAEGGPFASVEFVTSSAAPISDELFQDITDVIDPSYFYNTYGMSEIFPPYAKVNLRGEDDSRIFGHAESTQGLRIVELGSDDPTTETAVGEEGELIVKQDCAGAFNGYWSDHDEASATIIDGWYFTRDAAIETDTGHYVLTGRIDDRIKFVGENVYPENIEAMLTNHPKVKMASVVGIDDEEYGEVPKATVVADGLDATELEQYCIDSDALEDFKIPREYEFVDELTDAGPI